MNLQHAVGRPGKPHLAAHHAPVHGVPPRHEHVVEVHVPHHLEERAALDPGRPQPEYAPGALVDEDDVIMAVGGDDPFDHGVEHRRRLGLLPLQVADLLPQTPRHHVQGAAEGADLVRRAGGSAHVNILKAPKQVAARLSRGAANITPRATSNATAPPARAAPRSVS